MQHVKLALEFLFTLCGLASIALMWAAVTS